MEILKILWAIFGIGFGVCALAYCSLCLYLDGKEVKNRFLLWLLGY